jgi:hypothetical protein
MPGWDESGGGVRGGREAFRDEDGRGAGAPEVVDVALVGEEAEVAGGCLAEAGEAGQHGVRGTGEDPAAGEGGGLSESDFHGAAGGGRVRELLDLGGFPGWGRWGGRSCWGGFGGSVL